MLIVTDREIDGRWLAEVPVLPGALAYGESKGEVRKKVAVLALRILADRLEHGEPIPDEVRRIFT